MLIGNDISVFQGQIDFGVYKKNTNFLFAKATEGTGLIDGWYGYNRTQARLAGIPFGSYHFARPDLGNSPQDEAAYFCKVIDGDPIQEGELLALDFEVTYQDGINWCKAFLDAVSNHFGFKPLIYLNQSQTKLDWSSVVNVGYGLWLASYQADGVGDTGKWPFMALQQTSSSQQVPGIAGNVDRDVFFGDVNAFKNYGYKKPVPVPSLTTTSTGSTTPPVSSSTSNPTPTQPTSTTPPAPPVVPQASLLTQIHSIVWGNWTGWPLSKTFWRNNLLNLQKLVKK